MLSTLALALAPVSTHQAAGALDDPHRQFDFWVGEWSVQNRFLQDDGTWVDADVTRARITPVCADRAVLEEWAGPFRGTFMNGFSLRAWHPEEARWQLLLFWTTDGSSSFGQLSGRFRHGRGEFFVPSDGQILTRYSFSDALPRTVRWDSAVSDDGGSTWKTDWIMEFSRTRTAAEVTQDELFATAWTEGELSPYPAARALDWMIGSWAGTETDAAGNEREARMRCKLLDKDCLVLDLVETRVKGTEDWNERLRVRGFAAGPKRWETWSVAEDDTVLRRSVGEQEDDVLVFRGADRIEVLIPVGEDQLRIEELGADNEELLRVLELSR